MNDPDAIRWMRIEARKMGFLTDKDISLALGKSHSWISNRAGDERMELADCLAIVSDLNLHVSGKPMHALRDLTRTRHKKGWSNFVQRRKDRGYE